MIVETLAFYLFAAIAIASGVMVVSSKNPVHSVLFLILAFFNAAALFVLMGAEFLAMILVIVYVGAVAVLFLFVVMMLDVNFAELRQGFLQYLPVGLLIGIILLIELIFVAGTWALAPMEEAVTTAQAQTMVSEVHNTKALGLIRRLVKKRGVQKARRVLQCLAEARLAPIPGGAITAVENLLLEDRDLDLAALSRIILADGESGLAKARGTASRERIAYWRVLCDRWAKRLQLEKVSAA